MGAQGRAATGVCERVGITQERSVSTNEWLTPQELINLMGPFDLDPCAPCSMAHMGGPKPWATASFHLCKCKDGLAFPWPSTDRVWLNPPYGQQIGKWMKKLADHSNGIALAFARTDAAWFQEHVFDRAFALFFMKTRLLFYTATGDAADFEASAASVLVAYGQRNVESLRALQIPGHFLWLR